MVVAGVSGEISAGERLKPYVPRLVIDWLRETPDLRHQAVQGSVAFVDISGFTQLTEKLARRGKVGAEEVSDTLDTIFTQLLDVAYEYDARLLKWGGDALLLLFGGEDHAPRCCRAAAGMQQTLERIGRLRVGGARVTLRMSVGIHSGAFDFFLVGDSHRELIITGPAATTAVAMESVADAGEIAVSPATVELIGANQVGRRKGDAVLLERAPDVEPNPAPDVGDVSDIDLPSCVPVELRKQLLTEQGEAEHRSISVAFLQFSATDNLLVREGPAALAHALHDLVANVQRACERFAVTFFATDINADGGKIILVTGAPWSGGNDEERLLRAIRMIMDQPGDIPVRIGVNSGRAFTCDFGPTYRRTYQIYGDAVNLAARVMAKGQPGQALATADTLSRTRTAYELEELEPFMVKGKSEPVHASVVGAIAGSKEVERTGTPLVGRDEEMAALTGAADSARGGEGRVVELIGEPGIGKSRLVQELETRSGIASFWAVCDEYESSTPYFSFRGLLHGLLGVPREASQTEVERTLRRRVTEVAPELEPWIPLLGSALGFDLPATPETSKLDERFVPDRTAETLIQLLTALRGEPTLFVFDDVHWMDEASVGVLALVSEQVAERPWLVLVTRRDVTTGFAAAAGPHVVALRPLPLSGEAAVELAKVATEDVPLPPHVLEGLTERSGGNPFFLSELVSAAIAGAALDELPGSVEALMAANIDRLEPSERTVLRFAAVLGASFETSLLTEALHQEIPSLDDDLWNRLEEFLGEEEPGVLRFRHALIRDASYEGLPYRRRRELHGRVGETIERRAGTKADDEAERLSLHYFEAHDFPKAWRYSRLAGERAAAIYANVEAAAFYERALASVRRIRPVQSDELGALAEVLGDVRIRLNEFPQASRAYRIARRRLPEEPLVQARLLTKEAMIPYRLGRRPQALRWFNRALHTLAGNDGSDAAAQRARLFVWCAMVRADQHRLDEAVDWCRRAIDEAERAGARDVLAHAYHVLDWAYLGLGRPEEAVYGARAIAIHEELGDLDRLSAALNNLGVRAYMDGRWAEALELIERARQASETVGDRARASYAAMNIADYLLDQGRLEEAEPILRDILRIWRAAGSEIDVAEAASLLGRLETRAGRFAQARALLEEARELSEREGDDVKILIADVWLAECLVMEGTFARAWSLADDALRQAGEMQGVSVLIATLQRVCGVVLAERGDFEQARAAFEDSLLAARRPDANLPMRSVDYEVALTLDALAALARIMGEPPDALRQERDEILDRLGVVAIPESPVGQLSIEARR
jgi:class 3 adenylate cyclase/tetratricopeptide (TPR) repeat protein